MRALLTQVSQETWPFPQRVLDMLKGLRGRRDLQVSIWRPSEVGTELVGPQAQSHVGPGSQPLPPHAYLHQPQNNRRFGKAQGQSPRPVMVRDTTLLPEVPCYKFYAKA